MKTRIAASCQATLLGGTILFIISACYSSGKIEGANEAESGYPRKILPPGNSTASRDESNRSAVNRLLNELPEEAKGSDSEIVLSADTPTIEEQTGVVSDNERRRREVRAARTDSELVGSARATEDRNTQSLGEIDRQLGLEPVEKTAQSPSYILAIQKIRTLFKARQYEDSLIETNEALRHYPKSAQLLTMKGTVHQRLNQVDLALVSYERAYSIEPNRKLLSQIEYLRQLVSERTELTKQQTAPAAGAAPKEGR